MLTTPLFLIFPAAMIFAAVYDVLTMKIPNKVSILLVAAFLVAAPVAGLSLQAIGTHLLVGFCVLIVGFALFNFGYLGGGDAKLLAAASLWIGSEFLLKFLLATSIFGALLCLAVLLLRRFPDTIVAAGPQWLMRLRDKATGVPYGIAIGAGAVFLYPETALFKALLA